MPHPQSKCHTRRSRQKYMNNLFHSTSSSFSKDKENKEISPNSPLSISSTSSVATWKLNSSILKPISINTPLPLKRHTCQSWKLNSTIQLLLQLFNYSIEDEGGWGREDGVRRVWRGVLHVKVESWIQLFNYCSTIQLRGKGMRGLLHVRLFFFLLPRFITPIAPPPTITRHDLPLPSPEWLNNWIVD